VDDRDRPRNGTGRRDAERHSTAVVTGDAPQAEERVETGAVDEAHLAEIDDEPSSFGQRDEPLAGLVDRKLVDLPLETRD
jgi:hypothetical protein